MYWLRKIGISIAVSFLVTAVAVVGSLIFVMFATPGDAPGRRTALFDALFFEVRDGAGGAVEMGFGIQSFTPLVLFFVATMVFVFLFQVALSLLKQYRAQLIAQGIGQ